MFMTRSFHPAHWVVSTVDCARMLAVVLGIVPILAGCVSNAALVRPEEVKSVHEFTRHLKVETSAALSVTLQSIDVALGAPKAMPGYSEYSTWWCPRHKEVNNIEALRARYARLCESRGGSYGVDGLCRVPGEPDRVLFAARVALGAGCSGTWTAQVDAVEPTAGEANAVYIDRLRKQFGFRTQEDIRRAQIQQQIEAMRQMAAIEARIANAPRLRKIGTRVCRDVPYRMWGESIQVREVGFVEGLSHPKIQIRIVEAQPVRSGVPRFAPMAAQIIWDMPENWDLCE